jgi:hypothetical protein
VFVRLQDPGFAKQTEKRMSWNFVALVFGRKSLKNVNNITHTLFYSSEKKNYQNRPNLGLS